MKKVSANFFIVIICVLILLGFNIFRLQPKPKYKIIGIKNTGEFYIDFNKNNKPDENELVKLYDIDVFSSKNSKINFQQSKQIKLKRTEILALGLLAEEFLFDNFFGKNVSVEFYDIELNKNYKYRTAKVYLNNKDIAKILLNQGLATPKHKEKTYKKEFNFVNLYKLLEKVKKDDIVILNEKNNIYHEIGCQFAEKLKESRAIKKKDIPQTSNACESCAVPTTKKVSKSFVIQNFDFSSGILNFYFTDFNKRIKPDSSCETKSCKILLNEINNAARSIDFAIFGIAQQPKIIDALVSAQNRGVKIRWVTDSDINGKNIYNEVIKVQKLLPNFNTDNHIYPTTNSKNFKYTNAIMHNKFFIFDNKTLWLSTANLSQTDLADFNNNITFLTNSSVLSNIFKQEFEQMYNEKFHELKNPIPDKEEIKIDSQNTVSVYFSPTDKIITNKIVPLINQAKKYIYISSFIITHKDVEFALKQAKIRGVDVKIITDATSAGGKYSIHNELRQINIPVKVEDKAGKMHSKSIIIDDNITLFGSMNLTKSGDTKNDESVMYIVNPIVAKQFKKQFLYTWDSIPDKWLIKTPRAESPDSVGSCFDGIDNDFDGDVDASDNGCQARKK